MAQIPPPAGKKPVSKPAGNPYANIQVAPKAAPKANLVRPSGPAPIQPNPPPKFVLGTNQNFNPLPQDIENLTRPAHFAPFRPGLFRQDAFDAKFAQDLNRQVRPSFAFDAKFAQDLNRQGVGRALTPKKENNERSYQDQNRIDLVKQRKWDALTFKDNFPEIIKAAVPIKYGGSGKQNLEDINMKMEPYARKNSDWMWGHYGASMNRDFPPKPGTWQNALVHAGTSLNLANDIGFLPATALGLGHEYIAGRGDPPNSLYDRVSTNPEWVANSKMDIWNNFVGAGIGALPNTFVDESQKLKMLNWMLQNNMLSIIDKYDTRFKKRPLEISHPYVE